jgi:hypothetical protein
MWDFAAGFHPDYVYVRGFKNSTIKDQTSSKQVLVPRRYYIFSRVIYRSATIFDLNYPATTTVYQNTTAYSHEYDTSESWDSNI